MATSSAERPPADQQEEVARGESAARVARAALVARAVLVVQEHEADGHRADGEADEDAELLEGLDRQNEGVEEDRAEAPRGLRLDLPARPDQVRRLEEDEDARRDRVAKEPRAPRKLSCGR